MAMYKEREETDIETLRNMGIEITEPDREQFREIGLTVIEDYMQKYPEFKDMLDMLRALGAQ